MNCPLQVIPEVVLFRAFASSSGTQSRSILLRNDGSVASRIACSHPSIAEFSLSLSSVRLEPETCEQWSVFTVPPASLVKINVTLNISRKADPRNYHTLIAIVPLNERADEGVQIVKLRAVWEPLPASCPVLDALSTLTWHPDLIAAHANARLLLQNYNVGTALEDLLGPWLHQGSDRALQDQQPRRHGADSLPDNCQQAAAGVESGERDGAPTGAQISTHGRGGPQLSAEALCPPSKFSDMAKAPPEPEALEASAPFYVKATKMEWIGRKAVVCESVQSEVGDPRYSQDGEQDGPVTIKPVASVTKSGKTYMIVEMNGKRYNPRGEEVDEHGEPIDQATAEAPARHGSYAASDAGDTPNQDMLAAVEQDLRAKALSAAAQELGLTELPVPVHLRSERMAAPRPSSEMLPQRCRSPIKAPGTAPTVRLCSPTQRKLTLRQMQANWAAL